MKLLGKALLMAKKYHDGQFDKGGKPYIGHCVAVMNNVMDVHGTHDEQLLAIAILHDIVEDTPVTVEQIHSEFGSRVANGIDKLTKVGDSEEYLKRIKSNPDAIKVKLADLKHNMDLSRLPVVTEKDILRQKKYIEMERELRK